MATKSQVIALQNRISVLIAGYSEAAISIDEWGYATDLWIKDGGSFPPSRKIIFEQLHQARVTINIKTEETTFVESVKSIAGFGGNIGVKEILPEGSQVSFSTGIITRWENHLHLFKQYLNRETIQNIESEQDLRKETPLTVTDIQSDARKEFREEFSRQVENLESKARSGLFRIGTGLTGILLPTFLLIAAVAIGYALFQGFAFRATKIGAGDAPTSGPVFKQLT